MNLKEKLVGDQEERAVSPVIGVILMVAITVILAAVIAAFVLDLGGSIGEEAQAGIEVDTSNDQVDISVTSAGNTEELDYDVEIATDGDFSFEDDSETTSKEGELGEVGSSSTYTVYGDADSDVGEDVEVDVTVVGTTSDGTETGVQSTTVTVTVEEAEDFSQ